MKNSLLIFNFFLIHLLFNTVKSQTIKTYNGRFENGTATYSYYENEYLERIYHGNFSYKVNTSRYNGSASGKFLHNKKRGSWTYYYNEKILGNQNVDKYSTVYNYNEDGLVKGVVSINHTAIRNNKVVKNKTYKINVSNGFIVGKFTIGKLTGEFDSQGRYTGTWNYTDKNIVYNVEYIAKFKKGILINYVYRDISNGKILNRYDMDQSDVNIIDSLSNDEIEIYTPLNIKHSEKDVIDPARKLFSFQKLIYEELGILLKIQAIYPKGALGFFMPSYSVSVNGFYLNY